MPEKMIPNCSMFDKDFIPRINQLNNEDGFRDYEVYSEVWELVAILQERAARCQKNQ